MASAEANELLGPRLEGRALTEWVETDGRSSVLEALRTGAGCEVALGVPGRVVVCTVGGRRPGADPACPTCCTVRDVTDERARLAELEAANERSLALLDAIPDLLFRISSDLTFLDFRDPTTKGLGLPPEQFLGKRLADFLPPEVAELVHPNLVKALATGEVVTYPSYYVYEDGRHTFENRVVKSGPEEVVLICRDTTEQTRAEEELLRTRARLERIVLYSREYTSVSDTNSVITYASPPVERVLGYSPDEFVGMNARDLIHPDDLHKTDVAKKDLSSGLWGRHEPLRLRLRTKDGDWRLIEATAKNLFDDELIGGLLTHCRDITDYAQVEQTLRDSLGRLDAIVESAADGIVTLNADGVVESINSAAQVMFQCTRAAMTATRFEELLHPASRDAFRRALERAVVGDRRGLASSLRGVMEGLRKDGSSFPITLSASVVTVQDGLLVTVIVRDVSEQRALELQLEYQATHDSLTNLPNRQLFMAGLERALKQPGRGEYGAVLFLDLDRFKVVNDSLGHASGDRVIIGVADRLSEAVRGTGTVARFGGDEFLILWHRCRDLADVAERARRVLATLQEPVEVGEEGVYVGASAGVVTFRPGDEATDADALIRNADIALYRAKALGRGRFEMYDAHVDRRPLERLSMETALRRALERGEFVTHYQPIWSLRAQQYVGTEALIRWQRDGDVVPPSKFIGVAEEAGIINDLGAWVLRDACAQTVRWQEEFGSPGLTVAVNASGLQLDDPAFPALVESVVSSTGITPGTLILEITESKLIHDDRAALDLLDRLRATGIRLAIDDFGVGYSSLGYLRQLPVDLIKVDRSFVGQLDDDPQSEEIVRAIVTMAHTLGMGVVGEGVETTTQLRTLSGLDCDYVQGFLLARPGPARAARRILRHVDAAPGRAGEGRDPQPRRSQRLHRN
jgi:diguanylate cyclase (GGDEF)-like protein/PAS domain S-box-containing protein